MSPKFLGMVLALLFLTGGMIFAAFYQMMSQRIRDYEFAFQNGTAAYKVKTKYKENIMPRGA